MYWKFDKFDLLTPWSLLFIAQVWKVLDAERWMRVLDIACRPALRSKVQRSRSQANTMLMNEMCLN